MSNTQASSPTFPVAKQQTLSRLLSQEDTDGDGCISIRDRGPKCFELTSSDGQTAKICGTYSLANLLQDLATCEGETALIELERLAEPAPKRIERAIRERYWPGLTRRMDGSSLAAVLRDEKGDGKARLYLPATDPDAYDYYKGPSQEQGFELIVLPKRITPDYVLALNPEPGLLGLGFRQGEPIPYVVPGGRFNEMYGWDSYFIALGLVNDGLLDLAVGMAEQLIYQIDHYGKVLNANRTYYLTRSQPPFLTSWARLLAPHVGDRQWLGRLLSAAAREYDEVWMGANRLRECGLSRYCCAGIGYPPETLIRHYGAILEPFARHEGMSVADFRVAYLARRVASPELDAYFSEDRAVRESGHDTSYRLEGICTRLCPVELNSMLYRYERDFAELLDEHFQGQMSGLPGAAVWRERAALRQSKMSRLCWSHDQFFDYDWMRARPTSFVSATNFTPLWAGLASKEQAARMVAEGLPRLVERGGIAGSDEASRGALSPQRTARQWDFPFGWAPHQMMIWQGLSDYGYHQEAADLSLRWLRTIAQNAIDFNGVIAEKYDTTTGSHEIFAEYSNQGSEFRYVPKEGFGWTNASFQVGLSFLSSAGRQELDDLQASDSL